MPDRFEPTEEYERIDSPFDLDSGDQVTVVENTPSGESDVLTRDVEVSDVSRGGFAGEPEFEFENVDGGKESTIVGDQIVEATEGGARDRTAFRRQPTNGSDQLRPVGFERQVPSGKFAPPNTQPDNSVPPDRGPNGKFVSPKRRPVEDIGRRKSNGLFDLF